jgi:chromosome segregation ATPase
MSRWSLILIPLICLLLLTGNCECGNYDVPRPEHEYDPVKAAAVDSTIAELKAKVASFDDIKTKLTDLEEKIANNQPTNNPSVDELNNQLLRLGKLEQQIGKLVTDQVMQEKFKELNEQIAELTAALAEEADDIKKLATKEDLKAEKVERDKVLKEVVDQISTTLKKHELEIIRLSGELIEVDKKAVEADRKATEAKEKAEQADGKAVEADRKATEAKEKAEEANLKAQEAKEKAEEANLKAQEAKEKAEEANLKTQEAKEKAEEANLKAQEAKEKAEEADRKATEAKREAEKADRKAVEADRKAQEAKGEAEKADQKAEKADLKLIAAQEDAQKTKDELEGASAFLAKEMEKIVLEAESKKGGTKSGVGLFARFSNLFKKKK